MCCSMTCWDCMIMQDSDIIVSSRPDAKIAVLMDKDDALRRSPWLYGQRRCLNGLTGKDAFYDKRVGMCRKTM